MKVFIADHDGAYLSGFSAVVAEDEQQARALLELLLKEHRLSTEDCELKELQVTEPKATMIWNGDY